MREATNKTGGVLVDQGARVRNTFDVAMDDDTAGLHRLAGEDWGADLGSIPTADAEEQIRGLYAEKRVELVVLGAELNVTDFYRPPRSVRAVA